MKLKGLYNCVYINTWRVCQTRVHKSLIGNNLPDTLSLSLWGNKNQSQTSKTNESAARLSLAERWTITEMCRQSNSMMTYYLELNRTLLNITLLNRTETEYIEPFVSCFYFSHLLCRRCVNIFIVNRYISKS